MFKFFHFIFILHVFFIPLVGKTFAGKFTGYLIVKGQGTTDADEMYLTPVGSDAKYYKYRESPIKKIAVSIIGSLPHDVGGQDITDGYMDVGKIGEIPEGYGSGVVLGKFEIDEDEAVKNGHLVFRNLEVEGRPYIMSFRADDAYVHTEKWTGLTHEPAGTDLNVCLLFPNGMMEKVKE